MANARFNVPCPSCEGDVPITSTAAVGTKVECPKCKYRFTCPPDPNGAAAGASADTLTDAPVPAPKKKGNPTVVIGAVLGVVAVAVLVGGALFLFGDEEPKKPVAKAPFVPPPVQPDPEPTPDPMPPDADPMPKPDPMPPMTDPMVKPGPMTPPRPVDPSIGGGVVPKPRPPMTDPSARPGTDPTATPRPNPGGPVKIPPRPRGGPLSDPTNLLPNDTASVVRLNVPDAAKTPFYGALFDTPTRDLFTNAMSFAPDDMLAVLHATVGPDRDPFAVVRTKVPVDAQTLFERSAAVPARGSPVKTRHFFIVRSNPLMRAVGGALSAEALLPQAGIPVAPSTRRRGEQPLAVHVYDDQTLIVSTEPILFKFLNELQENGYPQYRTDLVPEAPPPAAPAAPGTPGAPAAPMPAPAPMPPAAPAAPGTPADPTKRKLYTSVPTYRTIDPALKLTLNSLEEDVRTPPAVLYAELVDQKAPTTQAVSRLVSQLAATATPATPGVQPGFQVPGTVNPLSPQAARATLVDPLRLIGLSLTAFTRDKFVAMLTLEYAGSDEAKLAMTERILPLLTAAGPLLGFAAGTTVTVTNQAPVPPMPNPLDPTGTGLPPGVPPGGESGVPPGGETGFPPGTTPGGAPIVPGAAGTVKPSQIDVFPVDKAVNVAATINWSEDRYGLAVLPAVIRAVSQIKGKMAVMSGETDWQTLAGGLPRATAGNRAFPRGALEREPNQTRMRLPFPPDERVSFLADLLPFIGRAGLRSQINDRKEAWFHKDNLPAAEAWVPEFVNPAYPPDSWRTTDPRAGGDKSLGGTNFVGIAGVGLSAARYNPATPAMAKKVGITGYEWGSTPAEVKDGLSNTMYMAQVPPNLPRPWIAGGGATLLGVDEQDDPIGPFAVPGADGKPGALVLMADGSVRWVRQGANPAVFRGMATRAGGESLADLDGQAPKLKPGKQDVELRGGAAPPPAGGK